MAKPSTPVLTCLLLLLLALAQSWAGPLAHAAPPRDLYEIDEFDALISYHSFDESGQQTQTLWDTQYSLSRYTPDDDFILQGMQVLVQEYSTEVDWINMYVYEDTGGDSPGPLEFIYSADVQREELQDGLVWLQLDLPAAYQRVYDAGESFWIGVGSDDTDAWVVVQDTDGTEDTCWAWSDLDASNTAAGTGDWIIDAGGTFDWDDFDLEATLLWNDRARYHHEPGAVVEFRGSISNTGMSPSPAGICQIDVRDETGSTVFNTSQPFPAQPLGGVYEIILNDTWTTNDPGRYIATMTVEAAGEADTFNNSTTLYQQVVEEDEFLVFDDGSRETSMTIPNGQGVAVMFTPAEHPAKAARMQVYFDQAYNYVELSAYRYQEFSFIRIWEYTGPVQQGWVSFALVSNQLINGSVAVVLEQAGGLDVSLDTSQPPMTPNPSMPYTYFLTDGVTWNSNPDLAGKPMVRIAYEQPTGADAIQLELLPDDPTPVIQQGESFDFRATLLNTTQTIQTVDIWTQITWPTGETFVPLQLLTNVVLVPDVPWTLPEQSQMIPFSAPDGNFVFRMNVGQFSETIATFDAFNLTVGTFTSITAPETPGVPREFTVGAPSPNPFNPATTLTVQLANPARLRAVVYDVTGRKVRTLHDAQTTAGRTKLRVDGRNLASGVYFVRVEVDGHDPLLRKITLVK